MPEMLISVFADMNQLGGCLGASKMWQQKRYYIMYNINIHIVW